MEQCERKKRRILTPFFSPDQISICEQILGKQVYYKIDGGYDGAERCRIAILPYEEDADMKITCLKATYSSQFATLSHRDLLGALLNLGLERETLGDLLVKDNAIYIFGDSEIEHYIVCNLTKIKRCSVHFQPYYEKIEYTQNIIYKNLIVSSLRLDVLVSALVNVSRKKAQDFIRAGYVKVNHIVLDESSYLCNNNSVISIRGHGRFHFKEVIKRTKKDHLVIETGKYQ